MFRHVHSIFQYNLFDKSSNSLSVTKSLFQNEIGICQSVNLITHAHIFFSICFFLFLAYRFSGCFFHKFYPKYADKLFTQFFEPWSAKINFAKHWFELWYNKMLVICFVCCCEIRTSSVWEWITSVKWKTEYDNDNANADGKWKMIFITTDAIKLKFVHLPQCIVLIYLRITPKLNTNCTKTINKF